MKVKDRMNHFRRGELVVMQLVSVKKKKKKKEKPSSFVFLLAEAEKGRKKGIRKREQIDAVLLKIYSAR